MHLDLLCALGLPAGVAASDFHPVAAAWTGKMQLRQQLLPSASHIVIVTIILAIATATAAPSELRPYLH